jgi:hypothetical protein
MTILAHFSQHLKRVSPLLVAPAALLLSQGQARAVLNVNIFDDGPNLKVTVTGSISPGNYGSSAAVAADCFGNGSLSGEFNATDPSTLCTGTNATSTFSDITGPAGFGGNGLLFPASSVTGPSFQMYPESYNTGTSYNPAFHAYKSTYALDPSYVLGQQFFSSATYNGTNLAAQGFTTTGLIGTWTIDGTSESINVFVGPPPVPGPLPLFGAGAALAWSRRLRKRTTSSLITPPQD